MHEVDLHGNFQNYSIYRAERYNIEKKSESKEQEVIQTAFEIFRIVSLRETRKPSTTTVCRLS